MPRSFLSVVVPTWAMTPQQVSLEIREQFKGEHVVFGAHVDENMGDNVQIIVLEPPTWKRVFPRMLLPLLNR